jgi:serine/threonine protein kinase/WD40 repeat protein
MPGHSSPADFVAQLEWVDQVADRFEAAWRQDNPPAIAEFLGDATGEERIALLQELVKIDRERRAKRGPSRSWEEYVREFPDLPALEEAASLASESAGETAKKTDSDTLKLPPGHWLIPTPWPAPVGYEILGELGHGGMGTVYKARQTSLKRIVALKMIQIGAHAHPVALARFRAEAEAVARLQHPGIVQIFEVGQQDSMPFFSLEYVDGGSLSDKLAGQPQPPRVAAELVEKVAQAVYFAHRRGVVHRDLKPSNILLSSGSPTSGEPWDLTARGLSLDQMIPKVADFGLAKQLEGDSSQTASGLIMGTPSYMAPEQAEGKVHEIGPAADTYALGAILYEMLTGSPPFKGATPLETLEQVRSEEPVPPRRLQPRLARDLETICLKALAKIPSRRYANAGLLAEDLRHFLHQEPILARPVGRGERTWRWCRRNPAWAGLAVTLVALVAAVVVSSVWIALASVANERELRRESLVQHLQLVRSNPHTSGWSREAWKLVADAAELRPDELLRNQAAASCAEMDTYQIQHLEKFAVSSLAFDAAGKRLLLGGRSRSRAHPSEGAWLWDIAAKNKKVSPHPGAGPVAFDPDGRPLHLVVRDGPSLLLCDPEKEAPLGTFSFPSGPEWRHIGLARSALGFPVIALAPDGSLVAAAAVMTADQGRVAVWKAATRQVLFHVPGLACALAFAPNGTALAVGDCHGGVSVWSLPEGKAIAAFQVPRVAVHCLAFSPRGDRLALGDSAGAVTIWNISEKVPVAYCYGSHHEVHALAFGPDGTALVSGGIGPVRFWDTTNGRLFLSLPSGGVVRGLAFAPDGRQLAVGSQDPFRVTLWELEPGRGIRTLRGLTNQAAHLCFSDDGRFLAALGHQAQVALWDLQTDRLRFLLEAPQGMADDAASLAFSADGSRFACAAGDQTRLWDTASGAQLNTWHLPPGREDILAFHPSGALLLFRAENAQQPPPFDEDEDSSTTILIRIRNLLASAPLTPVAEITEFNRHLLAAAAATNGSYFVADGIHEGPDGRRRSVRGFDGLTGAELWSLSSQRTPLTAALVVDPRGELFTVRLHQDDGPGSLVDFATGKIRKFLSRYPICIGPAGDYRVSVGPRDASGQERGYSLYQGNHTVPAVILGIDTVPSFRPAFNREGTLLAWSNADGTVSVCDLAQVRARLAQVGLDW